MKSLLDRDFVYVPSKDHGPGYMQKRMEFYQKVEEARAKDKAEKVQEIKPRIRSKS